MTAASAPAASRPWPATRRPGLATGRLLRLELRRNAMLWMLPVAIGLFWFDAYRNTMAMPPLWNMRAMTMQHGVLLDFVPPVVGGAAWMGWRDSRRHTTDMVAVTARPRWARQLITWAATTCWAMAGYLGCVGVLYAVIAQHAAWGGPLWWPAAVGAAGIPAMSAVGFAAGALLPSRFTTPLITVIAFFGLGFTDPLAHGGKSYGQISPLIVGAVDIGPDPGVGTFYHYLPDLSIAQMMLLAGLAAAALGLLGLPAGAGGRLLRWSAAAVTAAGLLAAGIAVALAGTARLDPHGMMIIPALHDAANDRPIRYTPVCSHTAIPVCLNPAYTAYLPVVTAALEPVLGEVGGLPGAPDRIAQAALVYQQEPDNGISFLERGPPITGSPPVLHLVLDQIPGEQGLTSAQFAAQVRADNAALIVDAVIYGGNGRPASRVPGGSAAAQTGGQGRQALAAVAAGLLGPAGLPPASPAAGEPRPGSGLPGLAPGTPAYAAARRFAALPAPARRGWLAAHLVALQAGRITLAQLP
jgi:hypothetical protein